MTSSNPHHPHLFYLYLYTHIHMQFWDVPSEEYHAVESLVFKDFSVVVLTFTLLKRESFETIKEIYGQLRDMRDKYSGKVLNKGRKGKGSKGLMMT